MRLALTKGFVVFLSRKADQLLIWSSCHYSAHIDFIIGGQNFFPRQVYEMSLPITTITKNLTSLISLPVITLATDPICQKVGVLLDYNPE